MIKNKKRLWTNILFVILSLLVLILLTVFLLEPNSLSFLKNKPGGTSSSSEMTSSQATELPLPQVSSKDWELILVNRDHPTDLVPPSLTKLETVEVDSRIAQAAKEFLEAVRQIEPAEELISGYRSKESQAELYNEAIAAGEAEGLSHEEAEAEVRKQIQVPGASEHQTGLALDISPAAGQSDELAAKISLLAPDYGFVLRYPKDKSEITGVDFENWHYRYVGKESARYMQAHNLVLEEYLARLQAAGR
ncbi:D-alanyl-D-alanine carboxypeptidase [Streptococcus oricebi]|uniref:D-alanyl-D-alanine carboxypeptidase n=2 Tax=Streptococcus oricebi TaxID=1547447 RepID=A0ABS5B5B4_9STRE|nr:D-alanyl-D-alanine carboxypeptidase [Streptococcus oricebi]